MKTVVGLFEDAAAKRVASELGGAGFNAGDIKLRTKNFAGSISDLTACGIPADEARIYVNELASGGTLVTVDCADADAPRAMEIMTRFGARDFSARRETTTTTKRRDDVIPIVQEKMQIGKQEYEVGGVRVHARIVETPVEQEISLREEHVNVDRRRVDRPATDLDYNRFDLQMVEKAEKAFATKSAHVVEEVRLGKTVEEHVEKIRDTVRHTEVDFEKLPGRDPGVAPKAGISLNPGETPKDYIPVVQERMQVGKREYESGGVAVHSRIVEEPVEQEVSLRDEHVHVDRRRVDRGANENDYRAGDLAMNERAERAFATKTAHVVEEIRLNKTVQEHKEKVRDSVRHTEIDVEEMRGNLKGWDTASKDYRSHFDKTFGAKADAKWEHFEPAYKLGHELGGSGKSEWNETEVRGRWEKHSPGTWERFKDAVREAFARARGRGGYVERHA